MSLSVPGGVTRAQQQSQFCPMEQTEASDWDVNIQSRSAAGEDGEVMLAEPEAGAPEEEEPGEVWNE